MLDSCVKEYVNYITYPNMDLSDCNDYSEQIVKKLSDSDLLTYVKKVVTFVVFNGNYPDREITYYSTVNFYEDLVGYKRRQVFFTDYTFETQIEKMVKNITIAVERVASKKIESAILCD